MAVATQIKDKARNFDFLTWVKRNTLIWICEVCWKMLSLGRYLFQFGCFAARAKQAKCLVGHTNSNYLLALDADRSNGQ